MADYTSNQEYRDQERQPREKRDVTLLLRLYPFIRPQKFLFLGAIAIVVLVTLLDLAAPYVIKVTIDNYIVPRTTIAGDKSQRYLSVNLEDPRQREIVGKYPDRFEVVDEAAARLPLNRLEEMDRADIRVLRRDDLSRTTLAAGFLLVIALVMFFLNAFQMFVMEYAGQKTMHGLRMKVFTHIQNQRLEYFSKNPLGRLVTRATNDVQNMHEMFTSVLAFVFKDFFLIVGVAVMLTVLSWRLALACFVVIPMVMLAAFYFASAARSPFRLMRIKIAEINATLSETIEGLDVIQLFSRAAHNLAGFRKINDDHYRAGIRQIHVFAVFMPVVEMLGTVSLAIVIYFGGRGVLSDTMTIGVLAAFISYIKMFFRPIRDMAEKFNITQNAISSAERIFLVLDTHEEMPAPAAPLAGRDNFTIDQVAFQQVRFSYQPDEPVLRDVSFTVNRGETVAIVGPTGAGKTSIANLILRFYDVSSGAVTINNLDIRQLPAEDIRSRCGLVMQDPFLFSGTIRDNIVFGNPAVTDRELDDILDQARCRKIVDSVAGGLDAPVSRKGTTFSSGQRQLISIARAFANHPDLIIFDEATSYIDLATEVKIKEALANLTRGRTGIIIAHRLSTVRHADRIMVLSRGRIIESGSHEELMRQQGFYHRLNRLQQSRPGE
ncbi:MAG: ABC transporter ATP-binding protein [Desulfosudaceae bacterium]